MLLTQLKAHNGRGDTIQLPLSDAAPIFVRSIDGLGPVRATIASTTHATIDGAQFHNARREPRNIVLRLGLDPDLGQQSVFSVRSELYSFFMPKSEVRLEFVLYDRFSNDYISQYLTVETMARVETNEPTIFSKDPGVDISMICFDPAFVDPNPVTHVGNTVDDLTEFTIDYVGTVDTGICLTVSPSVALSDLAIYQIPEDDTLYSANFSPEAADGDTFEVCSEFGNKYVKHTPSGGTERHVLWQMLPQSQWIILRPGVNRLRVYSTTAGVPFELVYKNRYGGL